MLVEQYLTQKENGQDIFLIPDPNLHEIISKLGNRTRRVPLDPVQIRALKRGKSFLNSARRGLKISRRASIEQTIEGDKSDFRIYKITEAAMAQYIQEKSISLEDIFSSVEHTLDSFIGKRLQVVIKKDTNLASLFFKNVSAVYIDSNTSNRKDIFPINNFG